VKIGVVLKVVKIGFIPIKISENMGCPKSGKNRIYSYKN
jgi:hypothetical protein